MADKVNYLPDGYHSVTPYLCIKGAADAIEFYKNVFGATELLRMPAPDGKIAHAEIKIGNSPIMLSDEYPDYQALSPKTVGGSSTSIMIYVEDADAVVSRAIEAGAKVLAPVSDKFYGDRSGRIEDPYGHIWHISTHIEDVPPEEMQRRAEAFMQQQQ
jgi:PhnB protein